MRKRNLLVVAVLLVSLLPAGAFAGKVVLPEETAIKVKFDPAIKINSGKLQPGLTLTIFLAQDVKIGGATIIEAGAEGTAKVEEIVPASRPGDPGKIKISFVDLGTKGKYHAADNARIKLGGFVENEGKGRKLLSWVFVLGLFIKGSQGEIDNMLEYPAIIKETTVLETS